MTEKKPEALDRLLARQDGMEFALLGLAIALAEEAKIPAERVAGVMEFMAVYAALTHSPDAGDVPVRLARRLQVCASDPLRPRQPLELHLLMHAAAGSHVRDAVNSWLSQATPDEISDDLAEVLRKYASPQDSSSGETESV